MHLIRLYIYVYCKVLLNCFCINSYSIFIVTNSKRACSFRSDFLYILNHIFDFLHIYSLVFIFMLFILQYFSLMCFSDVCFVCVTLCSICHVYYPLLQVSSYINSLDTYRVLPCQSARVSVASWTVMFRRTSSCLAVDSWRRADWHHCPRRSRSSSPRCMAALRTWLYLSSQLRSWGKASITCR